MRPHLLCPSTKGERVHIGFSTDPIVVGVVVGVIIGVGVGVSMTNYCTHDMSNCKCIFINALLVVYICKTECNKELN